MRQSLWYPPTWNLMFQLTYFKPILRHVPFFQSERLSHASQNRPSHWPHRSKKSIAQRIRVNVAASTLSASQRTYDLIGTHSRSQTEHRSTALSVSVGRSVLWPCCDHHNLIRIGPRRGCVGLPFPISGEIKSAAVGSRQCICLNLSSTLRIVGK